MRKQKIGIIIVSILIIAVIITSIILNKKINVFDNNNNNTKNNRVYEKITFNQFAQSDCIELNDSDYKETCELSLGNLKLSKNSKIEVKITRKTDKDNNNIYGMYLDGNEVNIDNNYNLYSIETLKYKDKSVDDETLFLVARNDQKEFITLLLDSQGIIKKELTTNYSNYNYEIEVLNDEILYLYYNTCSNNKLQRHRLSLKDVSKDKVLYSEKVLACE